MATNPYLYPKGAKYMWVSAAQGKATRVLIEFLAKLGVEHGVKRLAMYKMVEGPEDRPYRLVMYT